MRNPFDAASQLVARGAIQRAEHVDLSSIFQSTATTEKRLQNPKVAQQVAAYENTVYKALRFLQNEVAKLNRWVVRVSFETDTEGKRKETRARLGDNPISIMLGKGARGQPNPWTTSGNFLANIIIDKGLTGNHYALKVRNEQNGQVEMLVRIRPDWVRVVPDAANVGVEGFTVNPSMATRPIMLARSEVLHIKNPNPVDPRIGWSPLMSLIYAVDTGEEIRRFNWQFFEQGAHIDGVIEGPVGAGQVQELYDMLREGHYRGSDTGWLPLVLPAGMKFTQTQATAKDFEFAALAQFTENDILEAYNVPAGLLGTVKDVSLANLRGLMTISANNAVKPELRIIEEHIEADLLNEEEFPGQTTEAFLEFDFEDPTPGDPDQIQKQLEADLKTGVRTINEERADRGEEPVPWGEKPWLPINLVQPGEGGEDDEVEIDDDEPGPVRIRQLKSARQFEIDEAGDEVWTDDDWLLDGEPVLDKHQELGGWWLGGTARQEESISLEVLDAAIEAALGPAADQALIDRLRPLLVNSLTNGAGAIADLLEIEPTVILGHPAVEQYVAEHIPKLVGVNDTTRRAVRELIAEGIETATPINAQVRQLRSQFAVMRGQRAIVVARTENGIAWHTGSHQQILEIGAAEIWITSRNGRVRDSHIPMDGQCRPAEEAFETGTGVALLHPHDPAGPAEEVIQCRCTMAPEPQGCVQRSFLTTEEERTAYWRLAISKLLPFERTVRRELRRIWTEQENTLVQAIEEAA